MSKKVWLITGAGRGMGVDFARAAWASGHSVVASGRDRERVSTVLGALSDLLAVTLDVTSVADAEAAVRAAVDRFGRIDVLVNNAASFYAGYFEELTPEQIGQQLAASLVGPMNVTRAVLPVMRNERLSPLADPRCLNSCTERSCHSRGAPRRSGGLIDAALTCAARVTYTERAY
jgi:NAD(P)-dependent dehydrogenase (short-subunit alcohol dehydrogenase family)